MLVMIDICRDTDVAVSRNYVYNMTFFCGHIMCIAHCLLFAKPYLSIYRITVKVNVIQVYIDNKCSMKLGK